MEKLTLQNLCGGDLAKQFEAICPEILSRCRSGEKCSMTIKVDFERVADTTTMVRTSYNLKTATPGFGKASLCQLDAEFGLQTDEPESIPEPVSLFKVEGGKK